MFPSVPQPITPKFGFSNSSLTLITVVPLPEYMTSSDNEITDGFDEERLKEALLEVHTHELIDRATVEKQMLKQGRGHFVIHAESKPNALVSKAALLKFDDRLNSYGYKWDGIQARDETLRLTFIEQLDDE